MTDNPLKSRVSENASGKKVTVEMLREYAERLNRTNFVVQSGKPYFVARRVNPDSTVNYILDRQA